jgi:hypothetical protein
VVIGMVLKMTRSWPNNSVGLMLDHCLRKRTGGRGKKGERNGRLGAGEVGCDT